MAANFLNRCPSCSANLARSICDFTCGINQSEFMKVINTTKIDDKSKYSF